MENMVFEGCFYKANFTSPELHDTTLRLHGVDINSDLIVHVIQVAGTWTKELVIGILSRGDLLEGVMSGKDPLEILPLEIESLDRAGVIKQWIKIGEDVNH